MGILFKLVYRDFLRHRSMLGFAFLSIVAVCCLVVWFVAGIDVAAFTPDALKSYYGKFDVALYPENGKNFSPKTQEKLHSALAQLQKEGIFTWQAQGQIASADIRPERDPASLSPTGMGRKQTPFIFAISAETSPFEIEDGRWFQNPLECVISGEDAEKLLTSSLKTEADKTIKIGDKIRVRKNDGSFIELKVVGKLDREEIKKSTVLERGNSSTFSFGFGVGLGGGSLGPKPAPKTPENSQKAKPQGNFSEKPESSQTKQPQQSRPARGRNPQLDQGGSRPNTPETPESPKTAINRFGEMKINPTAPTIYVAQSDAKEIFSEPGQINFIYLQLSNEVKSTDKISREEAFYQLLAKKLGVSELKELGISTGDTRQPKSANSSNNQMSAEAVIGQAWATIGIVLIASIFIIFTTLSMGVSEKIRHLAMLRTVGFTRSKVAAYILLEGLALGILGWIAGLAAGWGLLTCTIYFQTGNIPIVTLTWPCILFAFGCAVVGALIASIIPAWRATRISPTESMVRKTHNLTPRQLFWAGIIGLLLLASIPILVFGLPVDREAKLMIFKTIGVVLMGLGFLLFFPWTIIVTEKLLGPIVARIFGFHPRFLANIFSGNQWRTLGVTIAMSIGLALFTAIHIWAGSMLSMFNVPKTIPNSLVRFQESVASPEIAQKLNSMPWIEDDRFMHLSVAQPKLDPTLSKQLKELGSMAGNAVLFGIDAEMAYRQKDPMLRMHFIEGSPENTREIFAKDSRVCVIPETLSVNGNLHVGDTIKLEKSSTRAKNQPRRPGTPEPEPSTNAEYAEYKIIGVVDFPWVWLSKCAGVRVSEGRTAAVIFVPYSAPLNDFGAPENEFFWFDTKSGTPFQTLSDDSMKLATNYRAAHPETTAKKIESFSGGTRWDSGINKNFVQVSTEESLNNSLNSRAYSVIETMTRMPLIILILSTIAVINTMIVSVRARRWEMGVLRACGITRFGLIRMILAEAALIGLCACVMSFCLGLFYAWIANQLVGLAPMFGVIAPPLIIDWAELSLGFGLAMIVCLLAGIYPAFATGLEETSRLLHRKD